MPDPQQNQKIDHNTITDSEIQQTAAGRDALSFQNSDRNNVTINNVMAMLWTARSQPEVDWHRAKQILEQQLPEIRQRLRDGLIQQQQFEIDLEEQPQQVGRNPLEAVRSLEISGKDAETLDPSRLIIEAFGREDIGGKLLILGAPGAGKTTMLLSLAEQLVVGALQNPQTTIPIVFELSTWKDDGQSIRDWLVEQLYENFGGNRKRKIYEQWLDRGVLLPLLDGLDELGMVRQRKCATQINEFARHYGQLVVCCRVREYEEAGVRLDQLRGAVCLQALTDGQIERYLNQVRPGMWAAIQESEQMRQLLEPLPDEEVGLLRVPLFVSIAAIVYEPEQPFGGKADLLEKYIDRQLSKEARESDRRRRRGHQWAYKTLEQEPDWRTTRHYLGWLATKMKQCNQTEFLIEKLQPSWLDTPTQKWLYRLIFRLLFRLSCGWFFGISFGLGCGLVAGLIIGGVAANIAGLFFKPVVASIILLVVFLITVFTVWLFVEIGLDALFDLSKDSLNDSKEEISSSELVVGLSLNSIFDRNKIFLVESFQFSKKKLLAPPISFFFMMIAGFILSIATEKVLQKSVRDLELPILFTFLGLCASLILSMQDELRSREKANQGIRESFKNLWVTTLLSYPVLVVPLQLFRVIQGKPLDAAGAIVEAIAALLIGLYFGGGMACTQHLALRLVLYWNNYIPWNYSRFLNYCCERGLLQPVGGRYRFLHKELLDHFAQDGEVGSQRL